MVRCDAHSPPGGDIVARVDQDKALHPEQPGDGGIVCAGCAKVAEGPPVSWTCSVEHGVRRYLCEDCARDNIRAIESRLDPQWW